jgi:type IV secretion system protein VirD4
VFSLKKAIVDSELVVGDELPLDANLGPFLEMVIGQPADKCGYFIAKEKQLLESLVYLLKADFPPEQQHISSVLGLAVWPEKILNARFTTAYQEGRLPKVGFDSWQGTRTANLENAVCGLIVKLKVLRPGKR